MHNNPRLCVFLQIHKQNVTSKHMSAQWSCRSIDVIYPRCNIYICIRTHRSLSLSLSPTQSHIKTFDHFILLFEHLLHWTKERDFLAYSHVIRTHRWTKPETWIVGEYREQYSASQCICLPADVVDVAQSKLNHVPFSFHRNSIVSVGPSYPRSQSYSSSPSLSPTLPSMPAIDLTADDNEDDAGEHTVLWCINVKPTIFFPVCLCRYGIVWAVVVELW